MCFYKLSVVAVPNFLISDISSSTFMTLGDLVKMAAINIESMLPPEQRFERLSGLLPYLSVRSACQLIFFPFSPFVSYKLISFLLLRIFTIFNIIYLFSKMWFSCELFSFHYSSSIMI